MNSTSPCTRRARSRSSSATLARARAGSHTRRGRHRARQGAPRRPGRGARGLRLGTLWAHGSRRQRRGPGREPVRAQLEQAVRCAGQSVWRERGRSGGRSQRRATIRYLHTLSAILPPSIRVYAWAPVAYSFSARFSCRARQDDDDEQGTTRAPPPAMLPEGEEPPPHVTCKPARCRSYCGTVRFLRDRGRGARTTRARTGAPSGSTRSW